MYAFIIVVHVIACIILIAAILFQAGRGAGISDLFGAGSTQTIFGARASTFLTRATTAAAIVFLLTCISLTVFSSRRGKSLMGDAAETKIEETSLPVPAAPSVPQETQEEKTEGSEVQE